LPICIESALLNEVALTRNRFRQPENKLLLYKASQSFYSLYVTSTSQ